MSLSSMESKAPESWTVASLHEHYRSLIAEIDRRYSERFAAQEKAVAAALQSARDAIEATAKNDDRWRANANEWRGAMEDRERRFVTKESFEAGKKAGVVALIGYIVGVAGLAATVVTIIMSIVK